MQVTANPAATVGTANVAVGNTITLTALELLTDGTTQALTGTVTYAVPTTGCETAGAAIINPTGTNGNESVSGQALGTCTITATEGTLTGTNVITVIPGTANYAYLASSGNNTINQFGVTAATAPYLTALTPSTTGAVAPQQVVLDPNGLYAYSIDGSARVYLFDIAQTGSTTPAPGTLTLRTTATPVVAGSLGSNIIAIDPTGRYLYVSDETGNTIYGFTISQTDGTLTAIAGLGASFTTNLNAPSDLVIDRTGTFLYAVNNGNATVSEYTIGAGGALTAGPVQAWRHRSYLCLD